MVVIIYNVIRTGKVYMLFYRLFTKIIIQKNQQLRSGFYQGRGLVGLIWSVSADDTSKQILDHREFGIALNNSIQRYATVWNIGQLPKAHALVRMQIQLNLS